jgi:hypothetical protein
MGWTSPAVHLDPALTTDRDPAIKATDDSDTTSAADGRIGKETR